VRNCYLLEEGLKYLVKVAEGILVAPHKIVVPRIRFVDMLPVIQTL
jgi:hypothetical protein